MVLEPGTFSRWPIASVHTGGPGRQRHHASGEFPLTVFARACNIDGSKSLRRTGNTPMSTSPPLIQDRCVRLSIKQPVHRKLPRLPPLNGYRPCANEAVVVRAGTCPSENGFCRNLRASASCWVFRRLSASHWKSTKGLCSKWDSRAVLYVEKKGGINAARRAD